MESSQKTRLILVVCANVLLSATVALSIWSSADKAKDAKETTVASNSANTTSQIDDTKAAVDNTGSEAVETIEKFPVSKRNEVQKEARKEVGTNDPMKSLRTASTYAVKAMDDTGLTSDLFVSKKKPSSKMVSYPGFVPPPPPDPATAPPVQHVAPAPVAHFDAIPPTPERKMFGIKVTGIIGNRAMLLMRKEGMSRSEKPEVVCLAPGEQVRNINSLPVSVLSVDKDRVTLEVDGDRFVKTLPEIR